MSRIGRLPIEIPTGVEAKITSDNVVVVKGPLGELNTPVDKKITVTIKDGSILVERHSENKEYKAKHGLYRSLIANTVEGVTKGFTKELIVHGVGYKVIKQGNKIVVNVGFSHPVEVVEPEGVTIEVPTPTQIIVKGINKEIVGQCAANIKAIKKPDPYHIYGIRYKNEIIVKKEGKTGK